jgi:antitoxin MazE
MSRATVGRWGKSLAIRIPGDLAVLAGVGDGTQVDVEANADGIVVRPIAPRLNLRTLFKGQTAEQWRAAYAGAFDWGPDVGREAVEE